MGIEIERKFLIKTPPHEQITSTSTITQGYLARRPNPTVRVRVRDNKGFLTVKGPAVGARRSEFEWEIPLSDAQEMLEQFCERCVHKRRHIVPAEQGLCWEIDEFLGENEGLWLAELELPDEATTISLPSWIDTEVTDDHRYSNSYLSSNPYSQWQPN